MSYFARPGTGHIKDPAKIKKTVANYFGFQPHILDLRMRFIEIKEARQIAMYFMRKWTKLTLQQIADEFSSVRQFDHSTVSHSQKAINNLIETDKLFKEQINKIEKQLN